MWVLSAVTPAESLADYGVLGSIVLISFGAIAWLARTFIQRESERADSEREENRKATQQQLETLTEKVIPAVLESSAAVKHSNDLQEKVMEHLLKVHDLIERLLEAQRQGR